MPKKLTYEFVKEQFEKEGYELLSAEYINNSQKLYYICPNNHKYFITWHSWKSGQRCRFCAGNIKKDIEFIRSEFEKEGYKLLTKKYKNCSQKLDYTCPEGHKHSIRWNDWKKGVRCSYCSGKAKKTIEFIRSEFEKDGHILVAEKYVNAYSKLDYICPKGHENSITWINWSSGVRCSTCFHEKLAILTRLDFDFIKTEFEKEGYKLLTEKYKNCLQKLGYMCPNGHKHNISWNSWKNGGRCPTCAIINNSGKNHYNWKGGVSFEPYSLEFNKELKKSILKRDNYQCQNPGCWGTNKRLTVHHIDYNKKNCSKENLITLCNSCNIRANFNREYWQELYSRLLYRKIIKRGSDNEFMFSD